HVWRLTECRPNFIDDPPGWHPKKHAESTREECRTRSRRARPAASLGLDAERRHGVLGNLLRVGGPAVLAHLRDLVDFRPGVVAGFVRTRANLDVDLGHPLLAVAHQLLSPTVSRDAG